MERTITPAKVLKGEVVVPGDKSISHRAAMIGGIAKGKSRIVNFPSGRDCQSTVNCLRELGGKVDMSDNGIVVQGTGLRGLKRSDGELDAENSGTTMRLLSGILAGQGFECCLKGDESLNRRPMGRIMKPLRLMGAQISGLDDEYPPLKIAGGDLEPIRYEVPVLSAQVKSCILLAGLYTDGSTSIIETAKTRDHTERMLRSAGANVGTVRLKDRKGYEVSVEGGAQLDAIDSIVPGDISAAAFFIVAAAIVPNSEVVIKDVGLNPTRRGILDILRRMGASISVENEYQSGGELVGDIVVRGSELKKTKIGGDIVPTLIDEIPILAVAATQATGEFLVRDAEELRKKETDRITALVDNLRRMEAKVGELQDGFIIEGGRRLQGTRIDSFEDHRTAMAFAVAGLVSEGETIIQGTEWVDISFPGFFDILDSLKEN